MRFSTVLAAAAAPVLALGYCITDAEAATVADNFKILVANFTKSFADDYLASSFNEQTDSVATLINNATNAPVPLGSLTFPNRTYFERMQGNQPPIPFKINNVWHDCTNVIFRWVSKMKPQQVQGITVVQVVPNPAVKSGQFKYQINTTYAEFNSGAWLVDLGNPQCKK